MVNISPRFHIVFKITLYSVQFGSFQSLSLVQLFVTPWTTACQASLSITNCRSSPKPTSIESVMPSNHLILCRPLLLLPSIFPSIRVFSNESALHSRWPKYWSFSFNISPSNEHPGLISFHNISSWCWTMNYETIILMQMVSKFLLCRLCCIEYLWTCIFSFCCINWVFVDNFNVRTMNSQMKV